MRNILKLLKNESERCNVFRKINGFFISVATLLFVLPNEAFAGVCRFFGTTKAITDAMNDTSPVWYSKPLEKFFLVADAIGDKSYGVLSNFMIPIIGLGFAFWLAFEVLKYVSPFYGQDPGDFFMSLGMGLFRVIFAIALLSMGGEKLFDYTIGMFVSTAGNISSSMIVMRNDFRVAEIEYGDQNGIMGVYASVKALAEAAGREFRIAAAYGSTIIGHGLSSGLFCIIPNIDPTITGVIMYICSLIFLLLIPLKLVDIALRLALLYALLPVFIAAWAFPQTKKYVKVAWDMVMYIVFFLLIMAVLVSISASIIKGKLEGFDAFGVSLETSRGVFEAFNAGEHNFFVFVGIMFVAIKAFGTTSELTGFISGGSGEGLAERIFGKAIAGVAGAAGAAGLALARQGGRTLRDAGGKLKGAKNWAGQMKAERNAVLAGREGRAGSKAKNFRPTLDGGLLTATGTENKRQSFSKGGASHLMKTNGAGYLPEAMVEELNKMDAAAAAAAAATGVRKNTTTSTSSGGPRSLNGKTDLEKRAEESTNLKTMVTDRIKNLDQETVDGITKTMKLSTDKRLESEDFKKALILDAVIRRKVKEKEDLKLKDEKGNEARISALDNDIERERKALSEIGKKDDINYEEEISKLRDDETIKEYMKNIDDEMVIAAVAVTAAAAAVGGGDEEASSGDFNQEVDQERAEKASEKRNIEDSISGQEEKVERLRRQLDKEMDKGMRLRDKLGKKGGEGTGVDADRYYSYDSVSREKRKVFIFKKKVTTISKDGEHYKIGRWGNRKIDKDITGTKKQEQDESQAENEKGLPPFDNEDGK